MKKEELRGIVLEVTCKVSGKPIDAVDPELRLVEDLGLDSIDMFDILALLSDKLSLSLERDDFKDVRTVGQFISSLESILEKA